MKILNTIIIPLLAVIQLTLIKPLTASAGNQTLLYKAQLVHFYENEINNLSLKYCVQFKNISTQILRNDIVQNAKTPLMQEFKARLVQYEDMYALYTRLRLNKALLSIVTHNLVKYYYRNDEDSQNILKLLQNSGYNQMLDRFERDFMTLISTKFLPKYEEFVHIIPSNETKEWSKVLKWGKDVKACQSYDCVYKSFVHFDNIILTSKEQLFAYVNQQFININLFYFNGTYHIIRSVLKHAQLNQLSSQVHQNLKKNLQQFIQKYESNRNLSQLTDILQFYQQHILAEFLQNDQISPDDGQLLKEIFHQQGHDQVRLDYVKKYQKLLDIDILKKFEHFEATLSKDDLVKERKLIESLKRYKSLKSSQERRNYLMEIVNRFHGI